MLFLAMTDGEASKIIDDAQAGMTCPSERPELLAVNIMELSSLGQNELNRLGQNALEYYYNEFERTIHLVAVLRLYPKLYRDYSITGMSKKTSLR